WHGSPASRRCSRRCSSPDAAAPRRRAARPRARL
ncbi:MAG: hypothetical protein AVDCRST_MAG30-3185, partial [uncultured Solirubrobacteraceae bacterium]